MKDPRGSVVRLLICGSRHVLSLQILEQALYRAGIEAASVTAVIHGAARGVDHSADTWARMHGIPVEQFPADWNRYGARAGPLRNQQMVDVAEAVLAIPCSKSRGTWDTVRRARERGLPVHVYLVKYVGERMELEAQP
jgi:hypothetical protein